MNGSTQTDTSRFRRLYPFRSHFVDLKGLACHYIDEGSGDPIIMVHGNPTWSFFYRTLVKGLSSRYRAIAVDHIGCGLSEKPGNDRYDFRLKSRVDDLDLFIEKLSLERKFTLIVHDWGGAIGMACALRRRRQIARLVVMNTAAFFPPAGGKLPFRLRLIRDFGPLGAVSVLAFNLFVEAALVMASRKGLSAEVKAGLRAPYNTWNNRRATLKFVQDIPLAPSDPSYALLADTDTRLASLSDLPMLILWGRHDFVFDDRYLDEWRRRFPSAEVHVFNGAGHYVLEDEPEQILARIRDFLERHPLPAGK